MIVIIHIAHDAESDDAFFQDSDLPELLGTSIIEAYGTDGNDESGKPFRDDGWPGPFVTAVSITQHRTDAPDQATQVVWTREVSPSPGPYQEPAEDRSSRQDQSEPECASPTGP